MVNISIHQGLRQRSKQEEKAYDNIGHFHEYTFQQKLGKFHWEWVEAIHEAINNPSGKWNPLLLLAPRDHAKTTICIESTILWRIGKNPQELAQVICNTSAKAKERLAKIQSCIRFSKRYKNLFGTLYPASNKDYTWNNDKIEVLRDKEQTWDEGIEERDPTLAAFGITTSVEGGRATFQGFDDVVGKENSTNEMVRRNVSEKFWMSFDPMLLPHGVQIVVGTRYHYEDLYSELIRKYDTFGNYSDLYRYYMGD